MTDDNAFLQAIIECPDDDAPRFTYADWLEGHGQPERAAFIRVQCALARLSEDDPRREELEDEQRGLLERHADAWLGPLRDLVVGQKDETGYCFRRGFVEEVALSAADFLRHGEVVFRANPVQRVTLREAGVALRRLADCTLLTRLTDLDLEFWGDDDPFAVEDFRALLSSPHLARLRGLDLSGTDLSLAGVDALVASPVLARLRRLDLGATRLEAEGVERLTDTPSLRGLTTLGVHNNAIGLRGVRALAACPYLAGLRQLAMGFNYVGDGCGEALASSPHLSGLTELYLSESHLGDDGLEALAASPIMDRVSTLFIDYNGITASGVRALAVSPYFGGLTELFLFGNRIGDEGARLLAASESLAGLADLCLGNCGITDIGTQALAASPVFGRLRWLDLWSTGSNFGNSVGDAGARALASAPHWSRLARLNVRGHLLSKEGEQALRATFGDRVQL